MTHEAGPAGPDDARRRWRWYVAWLVLGAGYALAVVGALTVGVFVVPVVVGGTVLVAARRRAVEGIPGLVSGLGVPLLYVAYLNRAGPGTVCRALQGGGQRCTDEGSPWPWAAVGVALVIAGAVVFGGCTRWQRGGGRVTGRAG